jgi:hypothetical protein
LQEIKHRSLGGMVRLGDQIAGSALFAHLFKAAEALDELEAAKFGCPPGQLTEALEFTAAET